MTAGKISTAVPLASWKRKLNQLLQCRLTTQQKEFERQLNAVRDLYFKLEKTNSKEAKEAQQQKLKEISQKHAKLRLRIDEQLRTLMKSYQPELSNEEKEWIGKLEKLSNQVSGESGYLARIKKVSVDSMNIQYKFLILIYSS